MKQPFALFTLLAISASVCATENGSSNEGSSKGKSDISANCAEIYGKLIADALALNGGKSGSKKGGKSGGSFPKTPKGCPDFETFIDESECVAGSAQVTAIDATGSRSLVNVRDLQVGSLVVGSSTRSLTDEVCVVEAIAWHGNGTVYGNYTTDHFVLDQSSMRFGAHGEYGEPQHNMDKWAVLTNCSVVKDSTSQHFAALDTSMCGHVEFSFSEYVVLHAAMLRTVRASGTYWLNQPYSNIVDAETGETIYWARYTPQLCHLGLQCAKSDDSNSESCASYEAAALEFVDTFVNEFERNLTHSAFPNLGAPGSEGSVSYAATGGKSTMHPHLIAVAVVAAAAVIIVGILALVIVRRRMATAVAENPLVDLAVCVPEEIMEEGSELH